MDNNGIRHGGGLLACALLAVSFWLLSCDSTVAPTGTGLFAEDILNTPGHEWVYSMTVFEQPVGGSRELVDTDILRIRTEGGAQLPDGSPAIAWIVASSSGEDTVLVGTDTDTLRIAAKGLERQIELPYPLNVDSRWHTHGLEVFGAGQTEDNWLFLSQVEYGDPQTRRLFRLGRDRGISFLTEYTVWIAGRTVEKVARLEVHNLGTDGGVD